VRLGEGGGGRCGERAGEIGAAGLVPAFDLLVEIRVIGVGERAETHIALTTGGKISAVWY
jgi:hypothetical protein